MSEATDPQQSKALDNLMTQLHERVEKRRTDGLYDPEIEQRLDEHFRRIAHHRVEVDTFGLDANVRRVQSFPAFNLDIASDSGIPGGEIIHRAVTKALARQNESLLSQLNQFLNATRDAVVALAGTVKDPRSHNHADLIGRLEAAIDEVASLRTELSNAGAIADLTRRIEQLESKSQG